MFQPTHILRKDVQHLWPELTLHSILLLAFAWAVPQSWPPHNQPLMLMQILPAFLHLLLPLLWLVIVSRLVHDESLVGDQQFWLTRPYTWTSLLASKLLFLITFVFLPFLAMQCFLLFHAGLHPLAALPGLLLNLLYLILLCFLPFFVLAAVTSTFPRLALSIIAALIYLIVLALLIAYFSFSGGDIPHTPPPQAVPLLITVYALFSVAILLYQYARRRSLYARIALVALPLLVAFLLLALPTDALFRQSFLAASANSAPQISFNSIPQQPQTGQLSKSNGNLSLILPITLAGQSSENMIEGNSVTFTVDSTGGNAVHYVGPWQSGGLNNNVVMLGLPEDVLKRLGGQPARLHITLATQRFAHGAAQSVTLAEHFTTPGDGVCLMASDAGNAVCRYALRTPPMTQFTGSYSTVPCFQASATNSRFVGMGGFNAGPNLVFLDPVEQTTLAVGNPNPMTGASSDTFLCPGTQLSFTQFRPDAKLRLEFDVQPIQLDHYLARVHEMPMHE